MFLQKAAGPFLKDSGLLTDELAIFILFSESPDYEKLLNNTLA